MEATIPQPTLEDLRIWTPMTIKQSSGNNRWNNVEKAGNVEDGQSWSTEHEQTGTTEGGQAWRAGGRQTGSSSLPSDLFMSVLLQKLPQIPTKGPHPSVNSFINSSQTSKYEYLLIKSRPNQADYQV